MCEGALRIPEIATREIASEFRDQRDFVFARLRGNPSQEELKALAERLERGPLPVDRALVSASQIAEALDAAHRKGVVHRDLKPSNVMLTPSGVKLLDFGLAKLKDAERAETIDRPTESLRLTERGTVLGTIPYMAPEQVEGREVDARTDIFALGAILYEMASGRPPFEGRSAASLISAILTHDPQPLSSVLPVVPPGVDRVLKKCLAKIRTIAGKAPQT